MYACAGYPVTDTWCKSIVNRNYLLWPNLLEEKGPAWIHKHLPKSMETTMGHLKVVCSNTRSTTKTTNNDKNNYDNSKNNIDNNDADD